MVLMYCDFLAIAGPALATERAVDWLVGFTLLRVPLLRTFVVKIMTATISSEGELVDTGFKLCLADGTFCVHTERFALRLKVLLEEFRSFAKEVFRNGELFVICNLDAHNFATISEKRLAIGMLLIPEDLLDSNLLSNTDTLLGIGHLLQGSFIRCWNCVD